MIAGGILIQRHLVESRYSYAEEEIKKLKDRVFAAESRIQTISGDCKILPVDAEYNWSHSIHVSEVVKMLMEREGIKLYKKFSETTPPRLKKSKKKAP